MLTLNELLSKCEEAIPIYHRIAEDEGMSGNAEGYDSYEKDALKLEKLIKAMREQLETNKVLSLSSIVMWLNEDKNALVSEILMGALLIVRDNKAYELKKLQEEVDFCDKVLKSGIKIN